jgi:hypothetical protein
LQRYAPHPSIIMRQAQKGHTATSLGNNHWWMTQGWEINFFSCWTSLVSSTYLLTYLPTHFRIDKIGSKVGEISKTGTEWISCHPPANHARWMDEWMDDVWIENTFSFVVLSHS